MTTDKVQDYMGGEIHRTANGNFVFIEGHRHAGEYATIEDLKAAVDGRNGTQNSFDDTPHDLDPSDIDKPRKKQNKKSTPTKAKTEKEG